MTLKTELRFRIDRRWPPLLYIELFPFFSQVSYYFFVNLLLSYYNIHALAQIDSLFLGISRLRLLPTCWAPFKSSLNSEWHNSSRDDLAVSKASAFEGHNLTMLNLYAFRNTWNNILNNLGYQF